MRDFIVQLIWALLERLFPQEAPPFPRFARFLGLVFGGGCVVLAFKLFSSMRSVPATEGSPAAGGIFVLLGGSAMLLLAVGGTLVVWGIRGLFIDTDD